MRRSGFLCMACTVMLGGCWLGDRSPYHSSNDGGTGGAPTCAEGELFDGECSPAPPCCVRAPMAPFEGLAWFKIVTEPEAIGSCPEPAAEGFKAYAEMKPIEPHTCGACSCSPAACTLPEGIHTNAAPCPGDGSLAVPLGPDPAAGWEGVCTDEGALPAGLQCGGEPCAQSVFVPTVAIAPCKAGSAPAPPFPDPAWGRTALQCEIEPLSGETCPEKDQVCAPKAPEGMALCLYVKAEQPWCPWEYPRHEVFYTGMQDDRGCETCQCSAPEGGDCMALFQVYSDAACGSLAGAVVVTEQDDSCVDVVPGTALGSFEASMVVDVPGSCAQSGGEPFGDVQAAGPLTLCCQGEPEPPT